MVDEYGQVAGLVTPLDLFEAIAGEFPDEDETLEIEPPRDCRRPNILRKYDSKKIKLRPVIFI